MQAIWITKHGGPEVLALRESPDPQPSAGQVRIRVRAAGLNFAELMAREGLYPDAPKPPCVVGYEVSGTIDAVGDGANGWAVGDRVLALTRFGGHADTVCVPTNQVRKIPDTMSFQEGAALPVVYLTAHHMLFHAAHLEPGMTVLVHVAGGAVGLAAVQLCRTVPNVTVLGTASAHKHDALRRHGYDHVIDYRTKDYVKEVRKVTDGRGVDLVLDPMGGSDWRKSYGLLRPSGMLVTFGFANLARGEQRSLWRIAHQWLAIPRFSPIDLMDKNRSVAGVNIGHLWGETDRMTEEIDRVLALYREGKIRPVLDTSFHFVEAAAAHRRLHTRKNVGKVVLVP